MTPAPVGALPPVPFKPHVHILESGSVLYRVHSALDSAGKPLSGASFNPGVGAPTRFAFFGDPFVPVLYAASTETAAVTESIFHAVPLGPATLHTDSLRGKVASRIIVRKELRLASLKGLGLRALGVEAADVTATPNADYDRTVLWAEAAYDAGFDGIIYKSRKLNDDDACVLFGSAELDVDPDYLWVFDDEDEGQSRLTLLAATVNISIVS